MRFNATNTHLALVATTFAYALPKDGRKQLIDALAYPIEQRNEKQFDLCESKLGRKFYSTSFVKQKCLTAHDDSS